MRKKYDKYKPSGVEWIGEFPEHWDNHRIKNVAILNPSKSKTSFDKTSDSPVVFLPMEKVSEKWEIDCSIKQPATELWKGFTYFERFDIILAKITPCFENGKGAYLNNLETKIGFGSTEFHVLRAKKNTYPKFLSYLLRSDIFMKQGKEFMTGSAGQQRVPSDFVENYYSGFPPLPEQTAIALFLDHKTSMIDRIITNRRKQIELLKEERKAIINKAVTKGINKNAKLRPSGFEWLGDIPEHWNVVKLKHIANYKSGDSLSSDYIDETGEFPVYGGNNIRGYCSQFNHDGFFILIGRQGALCGNINYAKGKFWATEHAVVVYIRNNYETIWLGELLRTMNLNQYSQSAAQPGLAVEMIKNLSIPLPSLEEQKSIVAHIEEKTAKIDTLITKYDKQINLLEEYRTSLISKAVTGQIDVREWKPDKD